MNCEKYNMRLKTVPGRLMVLVCIFSMCAVSFAASGVSAQAANSKKSKSEYVQILDESYITNSDSWTGMSVSRKKVGNYYWWVVYDYETTDASWNTRAVFKIMRSKTKNGVGKAIYKTSDLVKKTKGAFSGKKAHYEYIGVYVNDSYIVMGAFNAKKERVEYYRMTIDGKEKKTLATAKISYYHPISASNFGYECLLGVYGNYMYYCNCSDAYKVYKVNMKTGNKTYIKAIKKLGLEARNGSFDGRYMYYGSKAYDCKTDKLVKCSWYKENTYSGMGNGTDGKLYAIRRTEDGKAIAAYVVKNNKFVGVMRLNTVQLGKGIEKIVKCRRLRVTSQYIYFCADVMIKGDRYKKYYRYNRSTKKLWRMTEQKYNSLVRQR